MSTRTRKGETRCECGCVHNDTRWTLICPKHQAEHAEFKQRINAERREMLKQREQRA